MKRYVRNAAQYILAMAKNRRELGDYIEDHTPQVIVALAQLYVFPHGNRIHWRKEVWDKFYEMKKLSGKNKLPDSEFILENSYKVNGTIDSLRNTIEFVIDKEEDYNPRKDISITQFQSIVENYFAWFADYMSKNTFLPKGKVLEKLDELGLGEELTV